MIVALDIVCVLCNLQSKRQRRRGKSLPDKPEQIAKRYLEAAISDDTLNIYDYDKNVQIIQNTQYFRCLKCIFLGKVCNAGWKRGRTELNTGIKVLAKQQYERHFDGEFHNPQIIEYKVCFSFLIVQFCAVLCSCIVVILFVALYLELRCKGRISKWFAWYN